MKKKYLHCSRREFLSYAVLATGGGLISSLFPYGNKAWADTTDELPLKTHASRKGLIYGSSTSQDVLFKDSAYRTIFAQQCSILVPENELKWQVLRPTPTTYDFTKADMLYNFCQQNQMLFRGHNFVWHIQLPSWFHSYATPQNAAALLTDHITTVGRRYAGKVHSWDVVNEVLGKPFANADGLKDTPWMRLLGPEHIELAFLTAAKADPHALLVWNEDSIEDEGAEQTQKRALFLANLKSHLKRGVPIHAIGIQSHIWAGDRLAGPDFMRFLKEISDLGLKIIISEMDVTDKNLPLDIATRDKMVAMEYQRYLSAVLQEKAVIAVLTWGLVDSHSWLTYFQRRADGAAIRPLPLDMQLKKKTSWYAIAQALDAAPVR